MHHLTVVFRADREYEFNVHASDIANLSNEAAREWLQEEFDELECTPSNPVGKVLILDVILNVAKYGGEQRFAQGGAWANRFAACVAVVLDRPAVRIDVPGFVVG
ncbi:MAG: hypothetical protein PHI64_11810 [Zoogloea sp.]|uniref:hypothetical protein n=1 Tax=Zoogloea sp. TaxID=49181 RepID=UPI002607D074|nr:hypothetical protein [Zoogloea sp.]MDD2989633.1 hypothetical protein [Zoogloea sp.]